MTEFLLDPEDCEHPDSARKVLPAPPRDKFAEMIMAIAAGKLEPPSLQPMEVRPVPNAGTQLSPAIFLIICVRCGMWTEV